MLKTVLKTAVLGLAPTAMAVTAWAGSSASAQWIDKNYSESAYPRAYWGAPKNIGTFCNNSNATIKFGAYHFSAYVDKRDGTRSNCIDMSKWRSKFGGQWRIKANGDYVMGKGWPDWDGKRVVRYRIDRHQTSSGRSWFGLYGWNCGTRNGRPNIVEYYVIDRWGGGSPSNPDRLQSTTRNPIKTVRVDGADYDIWKVDVTSARPHGCGAGDATFTQYWSIRKNQRRQGRNHTITFGDHVYNWSQNGMPTTNAWRYQIIAMEAYGLNSDGNGSKARGRFEADVWTK